MKLLRTLILASLQLQSGRQAHRQEQASSPQAPVDRIRLLCSRLLLLLRENEKVAPVAWPHPTQKHTHRHTQALRWSQVGEHACMCKQHTDNGTCAYLHKSMDTCRLERHISLPGALAVISIKTTICRILNAKNPSVLQESVFIGSNRKILKQ